MGEARLIAKDGKETRLADLKPIAIKVGWGQLLVNKNWKDAPLKIKDKTFQHGVWAHADSEICYALDGKYERFEAWCGLDDMRREARRGSRLSPGSPTGFRRRGARCDFPMQCQWMMQDTTNRAADWLGAGSSTDIERAILAKAFQQNIPASGSLRCVFDAMVRSNAPSSDARWLATYELACRCRSLAGVLREIDPGLGDVRRGLEKMAEDLVKSAVPADDGRWAMLEAKAGKWHGVRAPVQPPNMATLKASIETLAKLFGGRFSGGADILKQVAERTQRWEQVLSAMKQADESVAPQLAGLDAEFRELRRSLLLGMRGMGEFLASAPADIERDWASQYQTLEFDIRQKGSLAGRADQTANVQALIADSDRDPADIVLRRTAALLADLQRTSSAAMAGYEPQLAELRRIATEMATTCPDARYVLFVEACKLRRQIAFSNPLLNFDKMLFIKRHRSLYDHMCDQFYGMAQRPGGGLYVLTNPFGGKQELRDVLASSIVANGRLKGQKIWGGPDKKWNISFDGEGNLHGEVTEGGSFLAPNLSYDGKSIVFAFVECTGDMQHRHHTDPTQGHSAEGRCYHVFKVDVDGFEPSAAHRRHVERFRSVLATQWAHCVYERAPRRLSALRAGLPQLQSLRHGRRRQPDQLPQLP